MIGQIPETAKEALENWDKGEPVFTVELGGLGPGYEQCIHIAIFEVIRKAIGTQYPKDLWPPVLDGFLHEVDRKFNLGLSGAQAGTIKGFALNALTEGWRSTLGEVPKDRHIQVSKHWPQLEAYAKEAV